ncbi:TRAP transporter small permease subunit [Amaricoccus tamworthensis]|uniref:TRAP transporter small permease subunit n=1 Tax=Amaricoccus tamworthensis TaxID=57002 RepID=UPI003C7E7E3B
MSVAKKTGLLEWLVPLAFTLCAAWSIWNGPAYLITFGFASEAIIANNEPAGLVDLLSLAGVVAFFIWGLFTVGISPMEFPEVRGIDRVSVFLGRVTMALVAGLVCVMFYEVVVRYGFEEPTLWANELSLWMASFVFLLSGLYAMQQRSHIRIFIIYDMLPRWLQRVCDIISTLMIVLFALALIYGGTGEAIAKLLRWETFGTAFDPPIPATLKPMILIIVAVVALQAISNLIADWNREPEHHTAADEIDAEEIAALKKSLGKDD